MSERRTIFDTLVLTYGGLGAVVLGGGAVLVLFGVIAWLIL